MIDDRQFYHEEKKGREHETESYLLGF